jgi:hypothetical protein
MVSLETINIWKQVINKFKQRADVQDGSSLGWKGNKTFSLPEDTPFNIGDGLGTTGWCVSASETLLNDEYFQLLCQLTNTSARLVSIDIKEQYWGYCYNGSQNKWHTAILMMPQDEGNFIIDITCRQFGNDFIDKDIWDLNTWVSTLRSPLCKHFIEGVDDDSKYFGNGFAQEDNKGLNEIQYRDNLILHNLKDVTSIDDNQRNIILEFNRKFVDLNNKLIENKLNKSEFDFISEFNDILSHLYVSKIDYGYSILEFYNSDYCKDWLENLIRNGGKLSQYLYVSPTIEDACKVSNIKFNDLYNKSTLGVVDNKTYLILKFNNMDLIDFSFIPNVLLLAYYNQKFTIKTNSIYDYSKTLNNDNNLINNDVKSNTIICELYV